VTTWRELVMTWGRVHSPSRGLRLRAVSLRYSIKLWSSWRRLTVRHVCELVNWLKSSTCRSVMCIL